MASARADADLHVVAIGSMVVDRVHRTARILTEDEKGMLRPVEGGGAVRQCVGGVVLNALGWAAALGLRTGIFGRQADDEYGRFLRAAMERAGIETHLALEGDSSAMAEIFVDDAGGRAIYMDPGATAGTTARHVREAHASFIRRGRWLHTEISQLPLEAVLETLRLARDSGLTTVVDVDVPVADALAGLGDEATLDAILRGADLLKPSKSAARDLVSGSGSDALTMARALRERFGSRGVAVTDGAAGCAICADGFDRTIPVEPVAALDTTGCGDAFVGGLLVGLVSGVGWEAAGRLANACGAACALQLGAFPEDAARARERVREQHGAPLPRPTD